MTVDLSSITFENDFATISLADGSYIVLNSLNESFNSTDGSVEIKRINIEKVTYDDDDNEIRTPCTSVIGLSDDNVNIKTDFTQLEGNTLNEDNMIYCTLEV